MELPIELLLINLGGRERIHQSLGAELIAVEPPLSVGDRQAYREDGQSKSLPEVF